MSQDPYNMLGNYVGGQGSYPDLFDRWQHAQRITMEQAMRLIGFVDTNYELHNKNYLVFALDSLSGTALAIYQHDEITWIIQNQKESFSLSDVLHEVIGGDDVFERYYTHDGRSGTFSLDPLREGDVWEP